MISKRKKLFTAQRRAERRKFYQHRAWKRIRAVQLKKASLCEMCLKAGKLTPANTCDHIDPTWETWEEFTKGPFQSLCGPCHREKTGFEDLPKLMKAERTKLIVWDV